jgi:hypothetical protein
MIVTSQSLQWLAHGGNGSTDLIELAQDYLAHNISVGAIDVDSTYAVSPVDHCSDSVQVGDGI